MKRLASHIARYEIVVLESLSLAKAIAAGTIETILGLDDRRIHDLEQAGIRDFALFAQMAPQMLLFKRLLDIAGPSGLMALCAEYQGLGRYAKLLAMVAAGLQSGAIQVPR